MKPILILAGLALTVTVTVTVAAPADAQTLYWLEGGAIQTSPVFGAPAPVVTGVGAGSTMSIDTTAGFLFWIDLFAVKRANLDGTGETTLISAPASLPQGMAVSPLAQRLYWLDPGVLQIRSINYDGSGPAADGGFPFTSGLAIDAPNDAVYYAISSAGVIVSNNLALNNEQLVVGGLTEPRSVALNKTTQELYWITFGGMLQKVNVDGTGLATLGSVGTSGVPVWRLQIDEGAGKLYFSTNAAIQRINLDGTGQETVHSGAGISDFALVAMVTPPEPQFSRGDCNTDDAFNIADLIFLLGTLFSGGPAGACADACDTNDDGALNIADAITGLGALFGAAMPLPDPFGACGVDPSDDALDCAQFPGCP